MTATGKNYEFISIFDVQSAKIVYVPIAKIDHIIFDKENSNYTIACEDQVWSSRAIRKLTKEEMLGKIAPHD